MKTAHEFFLKLNCIFHFNLLDLIKKNIQTAISIPCNCIFNSVRDLKMSVTSTMHVHKE